MLNEIFIERMRKTLGDKGLSEYLEAFKRAPSRALRFNSVKSSAPHREKISDILTEPLPFWDGAYRFECDGIGNHPYHHAGVFYVQEPSAMTPVSAVEIREDMRVLDTCASPGGKSTQAAERLKSGYLVSNEIVPARAKTLSGNIERLGYTNVTVTNTDTETLARLFPDHFDLVIVDAPCSGEGMFRKDSGAIEEWSEANVEACARRQGEILDNASRCVKKSGRLLYSTCTFSLEENEENMEYFLNTHPDFKLVTPSEKSINASSDGIGNPDMRRVYPHSSLGEGQFFALLERIDGDEKAFVSSALEKIPSEDMKICEEFLKKNLEKLPEGKLAVFKENIVLVPENLPVPERVTYSCGVTLGKVEKRVFRPHHQLFSALGILFKNKIDLSTDSPELKKFLHGETFNTDAPDGWACVTVDGASLGGVKVTSGVAKNHYPRGLRTV